MKKRQKKKHDRKRSAKGKTRGDAVFRVDRLGYVHMDEARKDQGLFAELTDEGFLRAKGRIARTGPQLYTDTEGNEWIEFRPEEEVFKEDSMKSFEMVVLTDDHPPEMITAENVAQYQKGYLGSNITRDGKYLVADILITDKDLIASILRGDKIELSCGYFTVVLDKAGVCPDTGTSYNQTQTDITGNHCSVVEEGRAGPACRLYFDARDAISGETLMKKLSKDAMVMLGEKEYEVPDEVAAKLKELMAKVAEMESPEGDEMGMEEKPLDQEEMSLDQEEEEKAMDQEEEEKEKEGMSMDAFKAKIDMLEAQIKKNVFDSSKIDARMNLVKTAGDIVPGLKTDGASDLSLMRQVVKAVSPSMDLKGKSRDYIKASYDMAVKGHKTSFDSNRELFGICDNAAAAGNKVSSAYDDCQAKVYSRKELN